MCQASSRDPLSQASEAPGMKESQSVGGQTISKEFLCLERRAEKDKVDRVRNSLWGGDNLIRMGLNRWAEKKWQNILDKGQHQVQRRTQPVGRVLSSSSWLQWHWPPCREEVGSGQRREADEARFWRASCAITGNLNSLLSRLSEDSLEDLKWSDVLKNPGMAAQVCGRDKDAK